MRSRCQGFFTCRFVGLLPGWSSLLEEVSARIVDQALEKAREIKPDLVLADVYMPGKNGYELCAALKQDPACKGTPVLLLTGSFEPFDEDKAREVKADAWLEKPFESQTLLDKVGELLALAETQVAAETPAAEATEPATDKDEFEEFSFDEEPGDEDATVAATSADDWSDLSDFVESTADELPASKETPAMPDTGAPAAGEEIAPAAEPSAIDEGIEDDDMFIFEDEPLEEDLPPVAASEPDVFDADDDIMALDDDDILGSEDLEPMEEEPTLAAWSREDLVADETTLEDFDAPVEEADASGTIATAEAETAEEAFESPAANVEEGSTQAQESAFGEDSAFPEPEIFPVFEDEPTPEDFEDTALAAEAAAEPPADVEDPSAAPAGIAPASHLADEVEARTTALSEAEIEAIVEKVAGRLIEKLAGTILERVAWEVVPDLAESLIREEISKIKDSAA